MSIGLMSCRFCGDCWPVSSITHAAGSYLEHAVREHWDMAVLLHEASEEQVSAAKANIRASGWDRDRRI